MSGTIQPPRPTYLEVIPEQIPAELTTCPQWVDWKPEYRPKGKKPWTKTPLDPKTGRLASVSDCSTWGSFGQALQVMQRLNAAGIGFVVTAGDPYVMIDLDECVEWHDDDSFTIAPWAIAIVRRFDSYTEFSPSGTGLRIILRGSLPPGRRRTGSIEVYDDGRYVTLTGRSVHPDPMPIAEVTDELAAWHTETFPAPEPVSGPNITAPPRTAEDSEILEQAMRARNGEEFRQLWSGDTSLHGGDHSAADLALCNLLRFWGGQDPERIDRLFRQSGLYRAKWEREDYRTWTITKALPGEVYQPPATIKPNGHHPTGGAAPAPTAQASSGPEPSLESCTMLLAAAHQEIAQLKAQLAAEQERSHRFECQVRELQDLQSRSMAINRNKGLGTSKATAQAIVNELAAQLNNRDDVPEDGMMPIPVARIAEKAGKSPDAAGKDITKIAEADVGLRKEVRVVPIERTNPETGQTIRTFEKRVYLGLDPSCRNVIDFTTRLATADLQKNHGGRREKICRECGVDAGTRTTISCLGCGTILEEHEAPPESRNLQDAASEAAPDSTVPETGILRHPSPRVDRRTKYLQDAASRWNRHDSPFDPPEHLEDLAKRLGDSRLLNERVFS